MSGLLYANKMNSVFLHSIFDAMTLSELLKHIAHTLDIYICYYKLRPTTLVYLARNMQISVHLLTAMNSTTMGPQTRSCHSSALWLLYLRL